MRAGRRRPELRRTSPSRGCRLKGFPASEIARWKALAEIQKHYLAILDGLGLWDMQTARQVAIDRKECRTEARVVLIGAADLNRSQRMILDQVADRVTALVFAPEELADHFDEHGCIRPAAWLTHKVPISDAQIEVAEGPADQAEAVVRAIAGFEGRYNTEQIVVGMADEQIVPDVEHACGGAGFRSVTASARSVSRSADFGCWPQRPITWSRPAFPPWRPWCGTLRSTSGSSPRRFQAIG